MAQKRGPKPPEPDPHLMIPLEKAKRDLAVRIALGRALVAPPAVPSDEVGYTTWSSEISTWHEYNRDWLRRFVGDAVAKEYTYTGPIVVGGVRSTVEKIQERHGDLERYLRRLESIEGRLHLWADEGTEAPQEETEVDPDGPIFVVHGHDDAALNLAVRVLDRTTGRDVIVLREQPNSGRTLIEKFEHHAAAAAFAVVLITGDDVGGPKGTNVGALQPRGRQNVVFELGFFFGKLGRSRVVVLLSDGVEKPSDIDGLVYYAIDPAGAWKTSLAKELEAAGIEVNYGRIP